MKAKLITMCLVLVATSGFNAFADGKPVALKDVPGKVIAAAKAKVKGIAVVRAACKAKDSGTFIYEVKGRVGNQGYELKVKDSGEVIDVEKENAVPILATDLPAAVVATAKKMAKGLKITEAEVKVKGAKKLYTIEGKVGKKEVELVVDGSGKVRKFETDDDEENDDHGKADDDDDEENDDHGKADDDDDDDDDHGKADDDDDDDDDDDGDDD